MKLSRRGKRTKHARRGKHTKRTGKHHTHRIKHRGKQYKRTYRKNNRKLKHNKRIQRGGWEWEIDGQNMVAKGVLLKYKKRSQTFGGGETSPFNITLEYTRDGAIKYVYSFPKNNPSLDPKTPFGQNFYGIFKVTMNRLNDKSETEKTFVVYFAVYGITRTITYANRIGNDEFPVVLYSSNKNFTSTIIIDPKNLACYGLSRVIDETNQSYNFPCGTPYDKEFEGNRTFFTSLINQMFDNGRGTGKFAAARALDTADAAAPISNADLPPAPPSISAAAAAAAAAAPISNADLPPAAPISNADLPPAPPSISAAAAANTPEGIAEKAKNVEIKRLVKSGEVSVKVEGKDVNYTTFEYELNREVNFILSKIESSKENDKKRYVIYVETLKNRILEVQLSLMCVIQKDGGKTDDYVTRALELIERLKIQLKEMKDEFIMLEAENAVWTSQHYQPQPQ